MPYKPDLTLSFVPQQRRRLGMHHPSSLQVAVVAPEAVDLIVWYLPCARAGKANLPSAGDVPSSAHCE
jgi:hypothetical protein